MLKWLYYKHKAAINRLRSYYKSIKNFNVKIKNAIK
jgi:hypothetical protein